MKLNKKLGLIAAAMLAVSPVAASVAPTQPVMAAKKKAVNAKVKKNMQTIKKMADLGGLDIVDSSKNPIELNHLRLYRKAPKITYTKKGNGKNGQGTYEFVQLLKAKGFPKSDVARDYLIEMPLNGVGGIMIGEFKVPANATSADGYIHFVMKTNSEGNKFSLPHIGKPVSEKKAKKVKKTKKAKKSNKKAKKSRKTRK